MATRCLSKRGSSSAARRKEEAERQKARVSTPRGLDSCPQTAPSSPAAGAAHSRHLVDEESGWEEGGAGTSLSPCPNPPHVLFPLSLLHSSSLGKTAGSTSQTEQV